MANIFNWKLNTPLEYINFFLVLASGIVLLFIYLKYIERGRSIKGASKRVSKKLKSHCLPDGTVLHDVNISIFGSTIHYDHLIIDKKGMLAIKVLNWGTAVYGEPRSEQWKLTDNKRQEIIPNPMLTMEANEEKLIKFLSTNNIYGTPIKNIVIMADPFDPPVINLGSNPPAIIYKEIKSYMKKRSEMSDKIKDPAMIINLINKSLDNSVVTK